MYMDAIIVRNRATLATVDEWITRTAWSGALFNYGLPDHVFHLIDRPIDYQVTEADMIAGFFKNYAHVHYLEIGVSVGKTFYQLIQATQNARLSCIDIEVINPTLHGLLSASTAPSVSVVPTTPPPGSLRKSPTLTISRYTCNANDVTYYEGDEFDPNVWSSLTADGGYNVVFSDALHEPAALMTEYKNVRDKLNADGFTYCFDDLEDGHGPMWAAVEAITKRMKNDFPRMDVTLHRHRVNGWLGQHEHVHNFGVIICAAQE